MSPKATEAEVSQALFELGVTTVLASLFSWVLGLSH